LCFATMLQRCTVRAWGKRICTSVPLPSCGWSAHSILYAMRQPTTSAAGQRTDNFVFIFSASPQLCSDAVRHRFRVRVHYCTLHACSYFCFWAVRCRSIVRSFVRPVHTIPFSTSASSASANTYIWMFTEPCHAGNTYSIKNVGSGTSRVFFSQAFEKSAEVDD
jgi:hypothetical protein